MRFSIRWMLAAVTYAAVVCASVVYAGETWAINLAVAVFACTSISCIFVAVKGPRTRPFTTGFAVSSFLMWVALDSGSQTGKYLAAVLDSSVRSFSSHRPNREAAVESYVASNFPFLANRRLVQIHDDNIVDRGPGKEAVVSVHFEVPRGMASQPNGFLMSQSGYAVPYSVIASLPARRDVDAIIRQHLLFLLSLLGGLLGLWLWKREERMSESH